MGIFVDFAVSSSYVIRWIPLTLNNILLDNWQYASSLANGKGKLAEKQFCVECVWRVRTKRTKYATDRDEGRMKERKLSQFKRTNTFLLIPYRKIKAINLLALRDVIFAIPLQPGHKLLRTTIWRLIYIHFIK